MQSHFDNMKARKGFNIPLWIHPTLIMFKMRRTANPTLTTLKQEMAGLSQCDQHLTLTIFKMRRTAYTSDYIKALAKAEGLTYPTVATFEAPALPFDHFKNAKSCISHYGHF